MDQETPNPGSDEARALGCRCPVIDNNHGRFPPWPDADAPGGGHYWIKEGCPVHAFPDPPPDVHGYYEDDTNVQVADEPAVKPPSMRLHIILRLRDAAREETAEYYSALYTEAADKINELELRVIKLENPGIDMAKVIDHREAQRVE